MVFSHERTKRMKRLCVKKSIFQGVKMEITSIRKDKKQQQQSISPSKWYDKNYVLPSIASLSARTYRKMTTILIKILVESFAFSSRNNRKNTNRREEKWRQSNKNKTIADCIKLNNLKNSQFYVGNLRITTFCSARVGKKFYGEGSTLWRGFFCASCGWNARETEVCATKIVFCILSRRVSLFNLI